MRNETVTLTADEWADIRVALLVLQQIAKMHNYHNTYRNATKLYETLMNAQYSVSLDPEVVAG